MESSNVSTFSCPVEELWKFQQANCFTDIALVCENARINSHRCLLWLAWPWLASCPDSNTVVLPGLSVSQLETALRRLYSQLDPQPVVDLVFAGSGSDRKATIVKEDVRNRYKSSRESLSIDIHQSLEKEDLNNSNLDFDTTLHSPRVTISNADANRNNTRDNNPYRRKIQSPEVDAKGLKFSKCDINPLNNFEEKIRIPDDVIFLSNSNNLVNCDTSNNTCLSIDNNISRYDKFESCEPLSENVGDFVQISDYDSDSKVEKCICSICGAMVKTKKYLKEHMAIHSDRHRTHQCDICNKTFATKRTLKEHLKLHEARPRVACHLCGKFLANTALLQKHVRTVHDRVKEHKCPHCEHTSSTTGNLQQHVNSCHLGIKYECSTCHVLFANRASLFNHQKTHIEDRSHVCIHCGQAFKRKSNLDVHTSNRHSQTSVECSICRQTFKSRESLNYHNRRHHNPDGQLECRQCGKLFVSRSKLRQHTNIHTGLRPFRCVATGCAKSYPTSDQLAHHKKHCKGKKVD